MTVQEDEVGRGGSLGELGDASLSGVQFSRGEAPLVDGHDVLEPEERVGRSEQRGTVWCGAECARELADHVATHE
jgi:hypothetical protein